MEEERKSGRIRREKYNCSKRNNGERRICVRRYFLYVLLVGFSNLQDNAFLLRR